MLQSDNGFLILSKPEVWESGKISHTVVPYWFRRPGYVRAMSKLILHKLQEFSEKELSEGVDVLFRSAPIEL